MSSFYNPLGIISPFLIRSKILLQELWKHGREWDKAISGDNGNAIKDWVEETELLGTVGLNRLIGGTGLGDTMELHVFCDASLGATAGSGSIHQDNQQPMSHNSFSYGKNKSGTFTSNNISQNRTPNRILCSNIEEKNRGWNGFQVWQNFFMEWQHDRSQLDEELQIETQDVHRKPNCRNKGSHKH